MQEFRTITKAAREAAGVTFDLEQGWKFRVLVLEPWLIRVVLLPKTGLPQSRSWMTAPTDIAAWEGRDRDDLSRFSLPDFTLDQIETGHRITSGDTRLTVLDDPVRMIVEQRRDGKWYVVLADRESGAYVRYDNDRKIRHYQNRDPGDQYFGLGDKSGPLNRHGRRFRLLQLDALGYDAEQSDPLYKHVPFFMVREPEGAVTGLFSDSLVPMTADLGCERSNYHGLYRYMEAEEQGLDFYILLGPRIQDVTRHFATLTGLPHFHPRWSFGFAFTSMHHADHPQAQQKISDFADRCRAEDIPISSIHFGSGYSSRGKRRYVFTWNQDKFPDAPALFKKLKAMHLYTVANLKPVLIDDHPGYSARAAAKGFITDQQDQPVLEQFWDGHGSFLDFTNRATIDWWRERLSSQVLDVGFDAGWNDNNEYEVWRDGAACRGFGAEVPAATIRPLQAVLMTRATFEETQARMPGQRPFTITRAGCVGLQRYAETWSGDNFTSWHNLKWNLRNGLSMALSGFSKVGHDIGGFAGPQADAELLCRWVEMMALHPRAVMNSWKPDVGEATEPWTHPSVTDAVRQALRLRYQFLPYMYSLAWQASQTGDPIIRPLFYDFDTDPRAYEEHDSFMLGPHVLVAPVVTQGATDCSVYLPVGPEAWVDYATGASHPSGSTVIVSAPLGRVPVFIRTGAALMLAKDIPATLPHDASARLLYVTPGPRSGQGSGHHFEDDGLTWNYRHGQYLDMKIDLAWDSRQVAVKFHRAGQWPLPTEKDVTAVVPTLAGRQLIF
ncbi:MAG: glycoside hydrolase family 31 protein [Alphaproteobacteria bacterium]